MIKDSYFISNYWCLND